MGSSFNVEYSSKVADVFITEEEAFEFSKARKKYNEENEFFNSYSRIELSMLFQIEYQIHYHLQNIHQLNY